VQGGGQRAALQELVWNVAFFEIDWGGLLNPLRTIMAPLGRWFLLFATLATQEGKLMVAQLPHFSASNYTRTA
jgi:hypothetical protein